MPTAFKPAVLAMLLAGLFASNAASAAPSYTWKYRPLFVFAGGDTSGLAAQRSIVAAQATGFKERDIVVVWIVGDKVSADFGPTPGENPNTLRRRYGVGAGAFRAVLVGKDGGVKLSAASPLAASTLFTTIDAMPMRRDEVRRIRKNAG